MVGRRCRSPRACRASSLAEPSGDVTRSRPPAPEGAGPRTGSPPATFSTAIDPACASMTPLAIARPSPAPASSGVPRSGVARQPDVEDPRQVRRRDPAAPVGDGDLDAAVVGAPGRHDDRPAARSVPDRVAHQVGHRPGQLVGVAAHGEPVVAGRHVEAQLHVAAGGVGRELAGDVVGQLDQADHRPGRHGRVADGACSRDSSKRSPTSPVIRSTVWRIWRSAAGPVLEDAVLEALGERAQPGERASAGRGRGTPRARAGCPPAPEPVAGRWPAAPGWRPARPASATISPG